MSSAGPAIILATSGLMTTDQKNEKTSQSPSEPSAAVAGARNKTENRNATASHIPPYAIVATRKPTMRTSSSKLGGSPRRRRPTPKTSSQSETSAIVNASRRARNLPSSSASR